MNIYELGWQFLESDKVIMDVSLRMKRHLTKTAIKLDRVGYDSLNYFLFF